MPSPATSPTAAAPAAPSSPPKPTVLSDEKVREMYISLLECQLLSESGGEHPGTSSSGMDAMLTGSIAALKTEDKIMLAHWNAAAGHLRGVPLEDLLARGKAGSGPRRVPGNDATPPILDLATGLAWGEIRSGHAVLVYPDTVAKACDTEAETLRFAFTRKLPAVFVTITRPAARDGSHPEQVFERSGMPCMAVDADDTVAIYRVAGESLRKAREGGGPTWIDCHASSAPSRKSTNGSAPQRPKSPAGAPLERMEQFLIHRGLFSSELKEKSIEAFRLRLRNATQRSAKRFRKADLGAEQGIFCIANDHSATAIRRA